MQEQTTPANAFLPSDTPILAPPLRQGPAPEAASLWIVGLVTAYFVAAVTIDREIHYGITVAALLIMSVAASAQIKNAFLSVFWLVVVGILSIVMTIFSARYVPVSIPDAAKGLWYILRPVVSVATGFLFFHLVKNRRAFISAICLSSIIISVIYIISYYSDPKAAIEVAAGNRTYVRDTLGAGTNLWGPAMAIAVSAPFLVTKRAIALRIAVIPVSAFALYISTGRTAIVWLVILAIILKAKPPRSVTFYQSVTIAIFLFFFLCLTPTIPMMLGTGDLSWVLDAPLISESAPLDQHGLSDISTHWRGYETFITYRYIIGLGYGSTLLGTGLGSTVPIGFVFNLGGDYRDNLPVFHNGFSFLLVRSGLAGIMIYALQAFEWIRRLRSPAINQSYYDSRISLFAIGIIIVMTFSLPTTTGFYDTHEGGSSMPFIFGYLLSSHLYHTKLSSFRRTFVSAMKAA